MTNEAEERARYIENLKSLGHRNIPISQNGLFLDMYQRFRWEGWQAARAASPVSAEQPTLEKFVLELAGIYGLDEAFMRALPTPTLEMWKMLVREEAKRHKSERETMEKFRAELIALKFLAATPSVASEDSATQPVMCPCCGHPLTGDGHGRCSVVNCKCEGSRPLPGSEDWMRKAARGYMGEIPKIIGPGAERLIKRWLSEEDRLVGEIAKHYAASQLSTEKK